MTKLTKPHLGVSTLCTSFAGTGYFSNFSIQCAVRGEMLTYLVKVPSPRGSLLTWNVSLRAHYVNEYPGLPHDNGTRDAKGSMCSVRLVQPRQVR